jgi:hypothetical protein
MFGYIIVAVGIGILIGLAIARLIPEAPATTTTVAPSAMPSAIGVDISGRSAPEMDARYQRMVGDVLRQPASDSGFRTLPP